MSSRESATKVLMVASSYPRFENDTASVFLKHFTDALKAENVRVHVLAPSDVLVNVNHTQNPAEVTYFRYFPECARMLAYGSGILPNIRKHPWLLLQVPCFLTAMFFSLLREGIRIRPHIIHAHWIMPVGFVAVLAGKLLRIPVIVSAHGGDAFGFRNSVLMRLNKATMRLSRAWTANTATTARAAYGADQSEKLHLIPMGVDTAKFANGCSTRAESGEQENGPPILLFVGRLVEKKGVEYLINAVADLIKQKGINVKLRLIGEGERRDALQQLSNDLGIENHVEFLGMISNDALPAYYAMADVFVAPSIVDSGGDTEGQGVVIIEAMAAGLPVVATKAGGIVDVICSGEDGVLVAPGDPSALSAALYDCLVKMDPAELKQMARKAQSKAQNQYDWRIVAAKFKLLYQSAYA